ncbi:hypothetical protein [Spirillospora sp. CA-128828]|uniref:hypothetical protein n=1 Tax=Spirillospora sp. CA-128828 TaxID=3240033 RepID=UPI003D9310B7
MTARIIAFPAEPDPMADVHEALALFERDAYETSTPTRVQNALRSPDASTVEITVNGLPVTLSTGPEAMTRLEALDTWRATLAARPPAGSHIHIAGGRVLVDCPLDTIGGAA